MQALRLVDCVRDVLPEVALHRALNGEVREYIVRPAPGSSEAGDEAGQGCTQRGAPEDRVLRRQVLVAQGF